MFKKIFGGGSGGGRGGKSGQLSEASTTRTVNAVQELGSVSPLILFSCPGDSDTLFLKVAAYT